MDISADKLTQLEVIFSSLGEHKKLSSLEFTFIVDSLKALTSLINKKEQFQWTGCHEKTGIVALRILRNSLAMNCLELWSQKLDIINIVGNLLRALCSSLDSEESLFCLLRCSIQVLVNFFATIETWDIIPEIYTVTLVNLVVELKSNLLHTDSKLCSYTSLLITYIGRQSEACWTQLNVTLHDLQHLISSLALTSDPNLLLLLEGLLLNSKLLSNHFLQLSLDHRKMVLSIVDSLIAKNQFISQDSTLFLAALFSANFTHLLALESGTDEENSSTCEEVVVLIQLLGELCGHMETRYPLLQQDTSFVNACLQMLSAISTAGKDNPEGVFSPLCKPVDSMEFVNHPAFGLKRDLVVCLGNLAYESTDNQTLIGRNGGLEMLLECTMLDAKNPFLQERAIVALRNLCLGNEDNSDRVRKLKMQGMVNPSGILGDIGLTRT